MRRRLIRSGLATFSLAAAAMALAGCQDVLFPADAPRTQFEVYDRMRNQYSAPKQADVFGRPQPALRDRLAPE